MRWAAEGGLKKKEKIINPRRETPGGTKSHRTANAGGRRSAEKRLCQGGTSVGRGGSPDGDSLESAGRAFLSESVEARAGQD